MHFEGNVRGFWSDEPEYAEEYPDLFNKSRQESWDGVVNFLDCFYVDTFKHLVKIINGMKHSILLKLIYPISIFKSSLKIS